MESKGCPLLQQGEGSFPRHVGVGKTIKKVIFDLYHKI